MKKKYFKLFLGPLKVKLNLKRLQGQNSKYLFIILNDKIETFP